jgi:hypothetical protein
VGIRLQTVKETTCLGFFYKAVLRPSIALLDQLCTTMFAHMGSHKLYRICSEKLRELNTEGCASLLMSSLFSFGRVTSPSTEPPFLEDQFVSLSLASHLRPVHLGRPYQERKVPAGIDKIRREVIRKELNISAIQDVKSKYKQNWFNHLESMDNTRLPKHALNYEPRGRRDRIHPRKRWQHVDARTGQMI